jgi:hypothetical protein
MKRNLWWNDIELLIEGVVLSSDFKCRWCPLQEHLPAFFMADDGRIREKTIAPAVVCMMMGVNHIPHRKIQFFLNVISHG